MKIILTVALTVVVFGLVAVQLVDRLAALVPVR